MTNDDKYSPADAIMAAATSIPTHPFALLTEFPAAEVLNLSIRTLQAWRLRGGGPLFVRLSGRAVRYRNSVRASMKMNSSSACVPFSASSRIRFRPSAHGCGRTHCGHSALM